MFIATQSHVSLLLSEINKTFNVRSVLHCDNMNHSESNKTKQLSIVHEPAEHSSVSILQ